MYMCFEGIMSRELKYRPLVMVDEYLFIVMVIGSVYIYKKSMNALE